MNRGTAGSCSVGHADTQETEGLAGARGSRGETVEDDQTAGFATDTPNDLHHIGACRWDQDAGMVATAGRFGSYPLARDRRICYANRTEQEQHQVPHAAGRCRGAEWSAGRTPAALADGSMYDAGTRRLVQDVSRRTAEAGATR